MGKTFKYACLVLLALCCLMAYLLFTPRSYDVVQMQQRQGTKYWNLDTGSKIGYTLTPAKGTKIPQPIIFLQGGPGGFISNNNIDILGQFSENGYDVYLYDQVGSGHSSRLKNIKEYTAERHTKDLSEIVSKIGADKVILIGQSWGAILATLYAADNRDKIEKIVFTGPGPIVPFRNELASMKAPDSLNLKQPHFSNAEANRKASNIRTKLTSFFAVSFGKKLASDKEADDYQTYLNAELNKVTVADTAKIRKAEGGGGYYSQIMTMQSLPETPSPRAKLKNSTIPVLILKGQYDNQKWGYLTEYLELFPNHKLVIVPNAGHSITTEHPEIYLSEIRAFLKN
ncbi:Proline iminopeptidase [compost metagenome]